MNIPCNFEEKCPGCPLKRLYGKERVDAAFILRFVSEWIGAEAYELSIEENEARIQDELSVTSRHNLYPDEVIKAAAQATRFTLDGYCSSKDTQKPRNVSLIK